MKNQQGGLQSWGRLYTTVANYQDDDLSHAAVLRLHVSAVSEDTRRQRQEVTRGDAAFEQPAASTPGLVRQMRSIHLSAGE